MSMDQYIMYSGNGCDIVRAEGLLTSSIVDLALFLPGLLAHDDAKHHWDHGQYTYHQNVDMGRAQERSWGRGRWPRHIISCVCIH